MEQLTTRDIRQLLARASGRPANPQQQPWTHRDGPTLGLHTPEPARGRDAVAETGAETGAETSLAADPLLAGVERRLVRRAEALWEALREGDALPPATSAPALLEPPFSSHAMLVTLSAQSATGLCASISHVGSSLAELDLVAPGPAEPDPRPAAPLAARLVALAERAIFAGEPAAMDSDDAPPSALRAGAPPTVLMRAVALPLATAADGKRAAVVVTSWRRLLSTDETAALHRELAAAIDWLQQHRAPLAD